jgi:hypothetical protein
LGPRNTPCCGLAGQPAALRLSIEAAPMGSPVWVMGTFISDIFELFPVNKSNKSLMKK